MSFESLIFLLSSKLNTYFETQKSISNGTFNQDDIDKWRIWHPCPIQPEHWHDDMLKYISFDISFVDSVPVLTMYFTFDDLVFKITGTTLETFTYRYYSTNPPETASKFTSEITEKIKPYLRVYVKIIEKLYPKPLDPSVPACSVLMTR